MSLSDWREFRPGSGEITLPVIFRVVAAVTHDSDQVKPVETLNP